MTDNRKALHTGGCQCGKVRYAFYADPYGSHICHCRMCQKAFGNFYAPLTLIDYDDFAWTRGKPTEFQSSPDVHRGFCRDCGTPLSFVYSDRAYLDISIGSLDHPERVKPEVQIGVESRIDWVKDLHALKEQTTENIMDADRLAQITSYQHPDHDTDE